MKTKENIETKNMSFERTAKKQPKPRSLRPMNSMVKVRSFRPRTAAAVFTNTKDVIELNQN